jgi:hypothetical protein
VQVIIANRWTIVVDFIATDRILLPSSTLHSIGSLHHCVKINRKNKRQSRFIKVMPRFHIIDVRTAARGVLHFPSSEVIPFSDYDR